MHRSPGFDAQRVDATSSSSSSAREYVTRWPTSRANQIWSSGHQVRRRWCVLDLVVFSARASPVVISFGALRRGGENEGKGRKRQEQFGYFTCCLSPDPDENNKIIAILYHSKEPQNYNIFKQKHEICASYSHGRIKKMSH